MLNKIKQTFAILGLHPSQDLDLFKPLITHEDQRDYTKRKRVADYIEQNKSSIMARSMRPHSPDCPDPVTCEDMDCWKFKPDKIVSKPYKVERKK